MSFPLFCTALNVGEWRKTTSISCESSTQSLRKICRIFWPNTISNEALYAQCHQNSMENIIMRRWRWIGHVMRKSIDDITRTALHWTPEGKRKRGRPQNTWWRTVEGEIKDLNHTWGTIQKLAQDRKEWKTFVAALCARRHNGQKVSKVRWKCVNLNACEIYWLFPTEIMGSGCWLPVKMTDGDYVLPLYQSRLCYLRFFVLRKTKLRTGNGVAL